MHLPSLPPRVPDRFKTPTALWRWLDDRGIPPAAVLRQARLPATLYDGRANQPNHVTTAQYFAIWRAIGELAPEPGLGLRLATEIEVAHLPPATLAAYYADDLRDALGRVARYKRLCASEEMRVVERGGECTIELGWPHATEPEPPLLTDAAFASFVELGRRGTRADVRPLRVELRRPREPTDPHAAYFRAPVRFRAARNALMFHARDLGRPFPARNAELLALLDAPLARALAEREAGDSVRERVIGVLRRQLAGRRPDVAAVARELGVSARTLQRRIAAAGGSFQQLLGDARRDLGREYLARPEVELKEVAYLLGYDDANSFHRAFRAREGTTPTQWRAGLRPETR
jgi:AraC-like DNA-binding protein